MDGMTDGRNYGKHKFYIPPPLTPDNKKEFRRGVQKAVKLIESCSLQLGPPVLGSCLYPLHYSHWPSENNSLECLKCNQKNKSK